jgi:hypothetical protein
MFKTLNPREKKTVLLCAAGAGLIVGWFLGIEPLLKNWKATRARLTVLHRQVAQMRMDPSDPKTIELEQLVRSMPVIEMPGRAEERGPAFQEEFTRQLRQVGLDSKRLQLSAVTGSKGLAGGYRILRLESQGQGTYDQVLRLLSILPSNPMYAGTMRLRLTPNNMDRNQMVWELTVFTYAR